jgi:hypothetical protein
MGSRSLWTGPVVERSPAGSFRLPPWVGLLGSGHDSFGTSLRLSIFFAATSLLRRAKLVDTIFRAILWPRYRPSAVLTLKQHLDATVWDVSYWTGPKKSNGAREVIDGRTRRGERPSAHDP